MIVGSSTTRSTTNGDSFTDLNLKTSSGLDLQAGGTSLNVTEWRPRFLYILYGGEEVDAATFAALQGGNSAVPVASASTRNYLMYDEFNSFSTLGYPGSNSVFGDAPDGKPLFTGAAKPCFGRVAHRHTWDLSGWASAWGTTNSGGWLTGGQVLFRTVGPLNVNLDIVPGSPVSDVYGFWNAFDNSGVNFLRSVVGAGETVKADGSSVFMPPHEFFALPVQHVTDPATRFDQFTFVCLDTVTNMLLPNSFVPTIGSDHVVDYADPDLEPLIHKGSWSLMQGDNSWIVSAQYHVNMTPSASGASSFGHSGSYGTLNFASSRPTIVGDNAVTKFVQYGRPINVGSPFSMHSGFTVTVTDDGQNKLMLYDESAYAQPSLPILLGQNTMVEYHRPNHAAGGTPGPSFTKCTTNPFSIRHPTPTIERQFGITPPGVTSSGTQLSHKMFGDIVSGPIDFALSTRNGVSFTHMLPFKHRNLTLETMGALNGLTNAYIPISLGFLIMGDNPVTKTRPLDVAITHTTL